MSNVKRCVLKGFVFTIAALVLTVLIIPAGHTANFKKEYKLQVNVGPSFYWGIGATKFADLAREKTN